MTDIKLLKKPFNIREVENVPNFLPPYSFVFSMPNSITLICREDEEIESAYVQKATCSCFVLEETSSTNLIKSTSDLTEILTTSRIDSNVMILQNESFVFVDTNDAMNAVMLLSSHGYEVKYTDI